MTAITSKLAQAYEKEQQVLDARTRNGTPCTRVIHARICMPNTPACHPDPQAEALLAESRSLVTDAINEQRNLYDRLAREWKSNHSDWMDTEELDFHGIPPSVALPLLVQFFADLDLEHKDLPVHSLRIVTGRGSHSQSSTSRLRDAVEEFLAAIPHISISKEAGAFVITCSRTKDEAASANAQPASLVQLQR
jgi:DNA-nicking Smr family endonuclease